MAPTTIANDLAPKKALAKKKTTAKANKNKKGKYSGKPKRPLSAYNLFFQHERDRILRTTASPFGRADVSHDAHYRTLGSDPSVRTTGGPKKSRPPPHGKVGFAQLAKMIGARWKDLTDEELAEYESLASKEKGRYDRDLRAWQLREAFHRYGNESDRAAFTSAVGGGVPARRSDDDQFVAAASHLGPQQPHQPHQPSSGYAWHSPAAIGRLLAPQAVHSASPDRAYSDAGLDFDCYQGSAVSSGSFANYYAQQHRQQPSGAPAMCSSALSMCPAVVSSGSFGNYSQQQPQPQLQPHSSPRAAASSNSSLVHFGHNAASAPAVAKLVAEGGSNGANATWPIPIAKPAVEGGGGGGGGGAANATWPVLDEDASNSAKSSGGSGGCSSSTNASAVDADISRMIDLLMNSGS